MSRQNPRFLCAAAVVVLGLTASASWAAATADAPDTTAAASAPVATTDDNSNSNNSTDSTDSTPTPFKLTVGSYGVSGGDQPSGPGLDVNLRYTYGSGNVWVGWFRSPVLDFSQLRTGWDRTITLGPVRVLPSLQAASGGFFGGSIAVETGDSWFVGAGLGRTNLRNYANLNFDPNDSYTVYGGYRWQDSRALSLTLVRDNRLNPGQQDVHLVWSQPLPEGHKLVLDLLEKQGTIDGQFIRRTGLSVGYEWPAWFVRAAWDPKVNFTPQNMLRLSTGTRF